MDTKSKYKNKIGDFIDVTDKTKKNQNPIKNNFSNKKNKRIPKCV